MSDQKRPANTSDKEVRQFTVTPDDSGIRLDRWFKRNLPAIGFATVSRWARTGQIRVDGGRAKPEDRLSTGQVLRVPPGGAELERKPRLKRELTADEIQEARDMVILETDAGIVFNKPSGLATQGGSKTYKHIDGMLDAFMDDEDDIRPRLVHRLDKDTSGALLVAKTPGSASYFSRKFSTHSAKKIYWALVVGVPEVPAGTIEAPLAKMPGSRGEKMCVDEENGLSAKTRYRVVERVARKAAWVELQPLTGRTHQLRVHMEAIGHPIIGDGKYGGPEAYLGGAISRKMHLHARRLIIGQPGDGTPKIDVTAELSEHFAATMEQLGFDQSLSDASPTQGPEERSKAGKKHAARQHAKQFRKSQRGERRTRTIGKPPKKGGAKKAGPRPTGPKRGGPKGGGGRGRR